MQERAPRKAKRSSLRSTIIEGKWRGQVLLLCARVLYVHALIRAYNAQAGRSYLPLSTVHAAAPPALLRVLQGAHAVEVLVQRGLARAGHRRGGGAMLLRLGPPLFSPPAPHRPQVRAVGALASALLCFGWRAHIQQLCHALPFALQAARRTCWHRRCCTASSGPAEAHEAAAVADSSGSQPAAAAGEGALRADSPGSPAAQPVARAGPLAQRPKALLAAPLRKTADVASPAAPSPGSEGAAPPVAQPSQPQQQRPRSTRALLPARAPCPQCGGAGTVAGPHGPVPCTACQPWRRRPDCNPGAALLSSQDLDLSFLEPAPGRARQQKSPAPASLDQQQPAQQPRGKPGRPAAAGAALPQEAAAASAAEGLPQHGRRKAPVMTEERREAIRRGALRKGPHTEEHRRCAARRLPPAAACRRRRGRGRGRASNFRARVLVQASPRFPACAAGGCSAHGCLLV